MSHIDIHRNQEAAHAATGTGCACGGHDEGIPELDVQTIPHAVRHSAIFGVLDGLRPGFAVIISATHDPLPLLKQLEERSPGLFHTNYLDRGPERWRIAFRRLEGSAE